MELTTEERDRIYQEEKARHEAREGLELEARRKRAAAVKARERRTALGVVVGVVFVIVLFALVGKSGTPSPPSVDVGQEGRIASGAQRVIAGVDDASFDQVVKSQEAHDQAGLAALMLSGRAFFIEEGTRVLVIDRSTFRRKVRTLEGPAVGRAGWLPAEWVKR